MIICSNCRKKTIIATADFGGKFNCMICGKLQTNVPSCGHGKVCWDCEKIGYCKYCGKQVHLTNTKQVDRCDVCNCMTYTLMDEDGYRYCGKCKYPKSKGL